jgi:hypothetical protein
MAYTTINYDEGNDENLGYESVELHYGNNEKKFFDTGDFVKDWWNRTKFIIQTLLDSEMFFSQSSSVDHFIMDGAPYDSAYLHTTDDGKPVLKYVDTSDPNYLFTQREIYEGFEIFVPENTQPTFEELKELYK